MTPTRFRLRSHRLLPLEEPEEVKQSDRVIAWALGGAFCGVVWTLAIVKAKEWFCG